MQMFELPKPRNKVEKVLDAAAPGFETISEMIGNYTQQKKHHNTVNAFLDAAGVEQDSPQYESYRKLFISLKDPIQMATLASKLLGPEQTANSSSSKNQSTSLFKSTPQIDQAKLADHISKSAKSYDLDFNPEQDRKARDAVNSLMQQGYSQQDALDEVFIKKLWRKEAQLPRPAENPTGKPTTAPSAPQSPQPTSISPAPTPEPITTAFPPIPDRFATAAEPPSPTNPEAWNAYQQSQGKKEGNPFHFGEYLKGLALDVLQSPGKGITKSAFTPIEISKALSKIDETTDPAWVAYQKSQGKSYEKYDKLRDWLGIDAPAHTNVGQSIEKTAQIGADLALLGAGTATALVDAGSAAILGQVASDLGFSDTGQFISEMAGFGAPTLVKYLSNRAAQQAFTQSLRSLGEKGIEASPEALARAVEEEVLAQGITKEAMAQGTPEAEKAVTKAMRSFEEMEPSLANEKINRVFGEAERSADQIKRAEALSDQQRYFKNTNVIREDLAEESGRVSEIAQQAEKTSSLEREALAKKETGGILGKAEEGRVAKAQMREASIAEAKKELPKARQELAEFQKALGEAKDKLSLARKQKAPKEKIGELENQVDRIQVSYNTAKDDVKALHYQSKKGESYVSDRDMRISARNKADTIREDLKTKTVEEVTKPTSIQEEAEKFAKRKTIPGQERLADDTFTRYALHAKEAYEERLSEVVQELKHASAEEHSALLREQEALQKLIKQAEDKAFVQRRRLGMQDMDANIKRLQSLSKAGKNDKVEKLWEEIKPVAIKIQKVNAEEIENAGKEFLKETEKEWESIGKTKESTKDKAKHEKAKENAQKAAKEATEDLKADPKKVEEVLEDVKESIKKDTVEKDAPNILNKLFPKMTPKKWKTLAKRTALGRNFLGKMVYGFLGMQAITPTWLNNKVREIYHINQLQKLSPDDRTELLQQWKRDGMSTQKINKYRRAVSDK